MKFSVRGLDDGEGILGGSARSDDDGYYVDLTGTGETTWIDIAYSNKNIKTEGIGIDLGIKDLAICSNGNIFKNC